MRRAGSGMRSTVAALAVILGVGVLGVPASAQAPAGVVINEFVFNHTGADTAEFIEIAGEPGTDVSALSLVVIEGDGAGAGVIDSVFDVDALDDSGYWTTGFLSNALENGTQTALLVEEFAGSSGQDLDGDNDGTLDETPWAAEVDAVGVGDGGAGDLAYASVVLEPGFDGISFTPGGASRIPDRTDTDEVADWVRNDFDGAGLPGFTGTPEDGEALNTPGAENALAEGNGGEPELTLIHEIQGDGPESPLLGQSVTIEGVVTGIDDEDGSNFVQSFPIDAGIFVQEEPDDVDDDPATSEGIFVGFVDDRTRLEPGDVVRVTGQVQEQFGHTIIAEQFGLEPETIGSAPLPDPVVIDEDTANTQTVESVPVGGNTITNRAYYERLEGMLVALPVGVANSGGTNGFGELFLTPGTDQDRVFRTETEPGLLATDADARAGDPPNPLRPEQPSTTLVEGDLFDTVSEIVGPLAYSFDNYKITVQPDALPTVSETGVDFPFDELSAAGQDELRIASFNVENFFGPGNELDRGIVTEEEFARKRDRIAHAIDELLVRPEIVAVQEVNGLEELQAVADTLGGYSAHLEEGNDDRGIDVGFLVADGVEAGNVRQVGKDAPNPDADTEQCSDVDGLLFDRPPLAIDVELGLQTVTVFSNHFSSKAADDICRINQAAFVEDLVVDIEAGGGQAVVAGDLNAFEDELPLAELEDGETSLDNLWDRAPEQERYSFQFNGMLQTLDHILVTDGLDLLMRDMAYAHFDVNYFEREDLSADGHSVSDHDPPVVTLEALSIRSLSRLVDQLTDDGEVGRGAGTALKATLNQAERFRERGQPALARLALLVFTREVEAFSPRLVSTTAAEQLTQRAELLMEILDERS